MKDNLLCSHHQKRKEHLRGWRDQLLKEQIEKECEINRIDSNLKLVNAKLKYVEEQLQLLGLGQQELEV